MIARTARALIVLLLLAPIAARAEADPLPSWNDGAVKKAITNFVARVTAEGGPDFVAPQERIAAFDNDGTLWCEQPVYVQVAFALDRVKAMAPQHPEWRTRKLYKAVLEKDPKNDQRNDPKNDSRSDLRAPGSTSEKDLLDITAAAHSGMSTEAFAKIVRDWLATGRHPRFNRPYTELVYAPMVELLSYLRANGFKTYIVSGGGVEFIRPWAEQVYGIPPEHVIGSSGVVKFEIGADGRPMLMKLAQMEFVDDGPGKPVAINRFIARRPILTFGNSDGDLQMLQWTAAGDGARFIGLVHHTDGEREYAYDRQSRVGKLDKALDEANARGWTVVDMARDWRRVFPFEP
jgi:phosphoserine phosphatase